jgi:hypothetical protein
MMTILAEVTSQFGLLVSEKETPIMYAASEKQLHTGRVEIKVTAVTQSYEQVYQFTYHGRD